MSSIMSSSVPKTAVEDMVINFDYDNNDRKQFFLPGELMKGSVLLHLRSGIRVNRIVMILKGMANVSWEIPERKKTYTSNEVYIDISKSLLDGVFKSLNLGRGTHEFTFNHPLPETLPSSFRGVYGSVTYVMKVELEATNPIHNTVTSQPFFVFRRPPLSRQSYLPKELQNSKRFLSCCNFGKVKISSALTRWGGVPGENLLVNAQVMNWSDRDILRIFASIVMTSVYHVKDKKITFREIISQREDEYGFNNRHGRRWRAVKLPIPPYIADTDLVGCSIMDVTYSFQFMVELENYNIDVEGPVVIGGHPMGYGPMSDAISLARPASEIRDFPYYGRNGRSVDDFSEDIFFDR
ncbi:arrestin domain-containing protein 2-like [Haliotis asinina]|uniref:arrestin domain-containing protein 2-like n=1 Tax=Haliotis asinina TaxID=109174 RepID=UPI00353250D9